MRLKDNIHKPIKNGVKLAASVSEKAKEEVKIPDPQKSIAEIHGKEISVSIDTMDEVVENDDVGTFEAEDQEESVSVSDSSDSVEQDDEVQDKLDVE